MKGPDFLVRPMRQAAPGMVRDGLRHVVLSPRIVPKCALAVEETSTGIDFVRNERN